MKTKEKNFKFKITIIANFTFKGIALLILIFFLMLVTVANIMAIMNQHGLPLLF